MKVTAIKPYSVKDGDGGSYFIVKVETDEGIYGLGEVGIRNWGGAITQAIMHLSEAVIGPGPVEHGAAVAADVQGRILPGGQGVLLRDKRD